MAQPLGYFSIEGPQLKDNAPLFDASHDHGMTSTYLFTVNELDTLKPRVQEGFSTNGTFLSC
jgi:hypothetical protein